MTADVPALGCRQTDQGRPGNRGHAAACPVHPCLRTAAWATPLHFLEHTPEEKGRPGLRTAEDQLYRLKEKVLSMRPNCGDHHTWWAVVQTDNDPHTAISRGPEGLNSPSRPTGRLRKVSSRRKCTPPAPIILAVKMLTMNAPYLPPAPPCGSCLHHPAPHSSTSNPGA